MEKQELKTETVRGREYIKQNQMALTIENYTRLESINIGLGHVLSLYLSEEMCNDSAWCGKIREGVDCLIELKSEIEERLFDYLKERIELLEGVAQLSHNPDIDNVV